MVCRPEGTFTTFRWTTSTGAASGRLSAFTCSPVVDGITGMCRFRKVPPYQTIRFASQSGSGMGLPVATGSLTRSGLVRNQFGVNGGVSLTLRIRDTPWKFFMESRYNYAATSNITMQVVPVTFGFAYQ